MDAWSGDSAAEVDEMDAWTGGSPAEVDKLDAWTGGAPAEVDDLDAWRGSLAGAGAGASSAGAGGGLGAGPAAGGDAGGSAAGFALSGEATARFGLGRVRAIERASEVGGGSTPIASAAARRLPACPSISRNLSFCAADSIWRRRAPSSSSSLSMSVRFS